MPFNSMFSSIAGFVVVAISYIIQSLPYGMYRLSMNEEAIRKYILLG